MSNDLPFFGKLGKRQKLHLKHLLITASVYMQIKLDYYIHYTLLIFMDAILNFWKTLKIVHYVSSSRKNNFELLWQNAS